MDSATGAAPPGALQTLGARLRTARRERGMSQQQLAEPEFTKSYVSAVERGKARPSLKALDLMARRLGIPMTDLLVAPLPESPAPDLDALGAALVAGLDQATLLLDGDQAAATLQRLAMAEEEAGPMLAALAAPLRYRLASLRASAYLQLAEPARARQELGTALALARQMDDPEAAEDARNLIGLTFYQQDLPRSALEQHEQCLEAIRGGTIQDPRLRLRIYQNLANDYAALNEVASALRLYQDAQELAQATMNLESQARLYRELSADQAAMGQILQAQVYAARATQVSQVTRHLVQAAQLSTDLAARHIDRQAYSEAEPLLAQARVVLQATGSLAELGTVYEHLALLELGRGDLAHASDYAADSLQLSDQAVRAHMAESAPLAWREATQAYVRALRVAGLVEEQRGRPEQVDALFARALALLDDVPAALGRTIELTYADLLASRGAHEQASAHYRAAVRQRGEGR